MGILFFTHTSQGKYTVIFFLPGIAGKNIFLQRQILLNLACPRYRPRLTCCSSFLSSQETYNKFKANPPARIKRKAELQRLEKEAKRLKEEGDEAAAGGAGSEDAAMPPPPNAEVNGAAGDQAEVSQQTTIRDIGQILTDER